jgi:regulator of protease activity HflC (stomatin/prohibitin superfamily)
MKKRILLLLALGLMTGMLSSCAQTAAVNRIGLYYDGGPFEGNHFSHIIKPGSGTQVQGIQDSIIWLPTDQRAYIVSKKADEGDVKGEDVITVPVKGGVLFDWEVSVYFKLNTHTNDQKSGDYKKGGTLRQFWEQVGKRYHADQNKGWRQMLGVALRRNIETAMRQTAFDYTPEELYANAEGAASGKQDAILQIQTAIARSIKDNVNRTVGGEFFCGPKFDRNKAGCPDFEFIINSAEPHEARTRASFERQNQSRNDIITAKNKADAAVETARGTAAAADAARAAATAEYIALLRAQAMQKCAEKNGCTLVITEGGGGSNVNVNAG